jgi:hypothetical protein
MVRKKIALLREKLKGLAHLLLRFFIVPVALLFLYVLGVGATKILLLFFGNPLNRVGGADSNWRSTDLGSEDESKYVHQS